jgi:hypothetical protein
LVACLALDRQRLNGAVREGFRMWKALCRGVGLVVGSLAAVATFFACIARIDSGGELDYLVKLDVVLGGLFAAALLLLSAPSLPGASARWHVFVVAAAVVVWAGVSGSLIWHHEEQVRIRSKLPVPHAAEE